MSVEINGSRTFGEKLEKYDASEDKVHRQGRGNKGTAYGKIVVRREIKLRE